MSKEALVLRGGLVYSRRGFELSDIVVEEGKITSYGRDVPAPENARVLDIGGLCVGPSFADLHCHLRYPGDSEAEDVVSGAYAGLLGGYGLLLAMPNTLPAIDRVSRVAEVREIYAEAPIAVLQAACVTMERAGERLVDMAALAHAGVEFFTDDGSPVANPRVMLEALRYSAILGVTISQHSEDGDLSGNGVVNEGVFSEALGLPSMPEVAESAIVARDIELLRASGGRLHEMHLSARESLNLVRAARGEGLAVTSEVTPHHLLWNDSQLTHFDTNFKVNPPIRSEGTRMALVQALLGGEFDAVATDHAPHSGWRKEASFREAPFGLIGLQSAFSATFSALIRQSENYVQLRGSAQVDPFVGEIGDFAPHLGRLRGLWTVFRYMSYSPRDLLGVPRDIGVGTPADLVVVDPLATVTQSTQEIASHAKNSPYKGVQLEGAVIGNLVGGEIRSWQGQIVEKESF